MYGKHYFEGYVSGIEVGKIIEKELMKLGDVRYKQFYDNVFNAVRRSEKVHKIVEGFGNGMRMYYHREEVIK